MMIEEFFTINQPTTDSLDIEVNRMIGEGWQPYGHTFITVNKHYAHTMVKYNEKRLKFTTWKGRST
jgi:hypothetical protein